jgi:hypothetical protein
LYDNLAKLILGKSWIYVWNYEHVCTIKTVLKNKKNKIYFRL